VQIRVYYEDIDVGGVVYYANYLKYCERARSEVFFSRGLSPVLEDGHFIVKRFDANYISSAKLGDELEVVNELVNLKAVSFTLKQSIFKGDEKIFEADVVLAHVDFENKLKKLGNKEKGLLVTLFETVQK